MRPGFRSIAAITLVLATTIATSGCSYLEQFFVINSSPAPLVVTAIATIYNRIDNGARVCTWGPTPMVWTVPASKVRRDHIPFGELKEEPGAVFDDGACSVRVRVDPGMAVVLWQTINGQRSDFLTKITLGDPEQRVIDGPELWKRFDKRSPAVYVIVHKK